MSDVTDTQASATSPTQPSTPSASGVTRTTTILLAVVVSAITSTASVVAYDHFYAQKIVAVDIRSFIEAKKADYVAGRLDDASLKVEMDKLEATVASIPKNKAVLMGDLVVKNVEIIKP
ncbi:MAG: hypothetical protein EG828_11115 [Deltaproteobacteria bacterium]|nr:hypothetical protein [Deltaproteobacteria bacterium]